MKKFLKTAGKVLLILILVPLVLVSLFVLIANLTQISTPLTTVTGQSAQLNEALAESWKNTPSHIEGMTKWDLYSSGLSLVPGADTDGDGVMTIADVLYCAHEQKHPDGAAAFGTELTEYGMTPEDTVKALPRAFGELMNL